MQIEVISSCCCCSCCSLDLRTSAGRSPPSPSPSPSLIRMIAFNLCTRFRSGPPFPRVSQSSCPAVPALHLPYGNAHSAQIVPQIPHQATWLQLGYMRAGTGAVNVPIAYRSTITKHIAYLPAGSSKLMTEVDDSFDCRLQWRLSVVVRLQFYYVSSCRSRRINKYYVCT